MSKTSVTLGMLRLLATQQTIKVSDFAELLETNPRNILEYKKRIRNCWICHRFNSRKIWGLSFKYESINAHLKN